MGKLTRRVKFIARERRLSIPAEFLHRNGIQRGDPLMVSLQGRDLYVFHPDTWERMVELAGNVDRWFPSDQHPFFRMMEFGAPVKLGSQDRVVLPKTFPFHPGETLRLHWDLQEGFLRLTPEEFPVDRASSPGARATQTTLVDYFGAGGAKAFDRKGAVRKLTERIMMSEIDHKDRCCSTQSPIPGEALLRSIRVEGIRRPVVLREREDGAYQIVHGFRRVSAARQLKMAGIPAVVFRGLSDEDRDRLKLMETEDAPPMDSSPLRRLQSTVKLYQGQVDLAEIEKITGRRKRTLQRYLRVAENHVLRDAIERGRLSIFKAEEILKAGIDPELAIRRKMTVKEIKAAARRNAQGRRPRRRTQRSRTVS